MLTKIVLAAAISVAAYGAPVFTATVFGSCDYATSSSAAGASARTLITSCPGTVLSDGRAGAGSSGLGVESFSVHAGGTATSVSSIASSLTDFMITGPAGPVTISLNLALSFTMSNSGNDSISTVELSARIGATNFIGLYTQRLINGNLEVSNSGVLAPVALCPTDCNLTTLQVVVAANTWIPLELILTGNAGGGTQSRASDVRAGNTLYFPLTGPVFNLPSGYTAVIPDMNVADNHVANAENGVPEPGVGFMTLAGFGVIAILRRRSLSVERP